MEIASSLVVISGISGRFPFSENLEEFWANLVKGVDMVKENHNRWSTEEFKVPTRMGFIQNLDKFDAEYFSIHSKQAHIMDPRQRKLLEVTHEAIMDAGINPAVLRGSQTGVFASGIDSDARTLFRCCETRTNKYGFFGNNFTFLANRISYSFDFVGPSMGIDTACSASAVSLHQAFISLRSGLCSAAIVASAQIYYDPVEFFAYHQLGVTSQDGTCKVFDASADGYVRSEAVTAMLLVKQADANRLYAVIVHCCCNHDGYKKEGISFPSERMQEAVMRQVYEECGVSPHEVDYLEAHGTGTSVGDPEEMRAVSKVFCVNRPRPLLVGSVKTNMGHTEPVSCSMGILKILLSGCNGILPSNLHYNEPNPSIPAILDGRIVVVSKNIPFKAKYAATSSVGIGGTNVHILLRFEASTKTANIQNPNIPIIVFCQARTENAADLYLQKAVKHFDEPGFVALLHELTVVNSERHPFRGYAVFDGVQANFLVSSEDTNKQLWYIFTGVGSQWIGMYKSILNFAVCENAVLQAATVLKEKEFDILKVLTAEDETIFENAKNTFVSITTIQVSLVNLLTLVGIKPAGIIGHSTGEVASGYADGCLTFDQTILCALARAQAYEESVLPEGTVASVELSWEEAQTRCPDGIYPALHNSQENVSLAGSPDDLREFVKELQKEGKFARMVKSASHGYHSPLVHGVEPRAQELLSEVIPSPKLRSKRWLSTSVPENCWDTELAQFASPEYYVNSSVSPVLFYSTLQHIPENGIALEIAPHCMMQRILNQSLQQSIVKLGLMNCRSENNCAYLLDKLGMLYIYGIIPDIAKLYNKIEFPLFTKTPISPLIGWDHNNSHFVPNYKNETSTQNRSCHQIDLNSESDSYLSGHSLGGKIIYPASGYLWLVWKTFAHNNRQEFEKFPVVFEDVKFERITPLAPERTTEFEVIISRKGLFEIIESSTVVCSGSIRCCLDANSEMNCIYTDVGSKGPELQMTKFDFYKEYHRRRYEHAGIFQGVYSISLCCKRAQIKWFNNWVSFIDAVMHFTIGSQYSEDILMLTNLQKLTVDPSFLLANINNDGLINASYDSGVGSIVCPGLEIFGMLCSRFNRIQNEIIPYCSEQLFMPLDGSVPGTSETFVWESYFQIAEENLFGPKLTVTEILFDLEAVRPDFITKQLKIRSPTNLIHQVLCLPPLNKNDVGSNLSSCNPIYLEQNSLPLGSSDIVYFVLQNDSVFATAKSLVKPGGFLIVFALTSELNNGSDFILITQKELKSGFLTLMRKVQYAELKITCILVDTISFEWLNEVRKQIELIKSPNSRLVLVSQNMYSGLAGFVKTLTKQNNFHGYLRCFEIWDTFSTMPLITKDHVQIRKDLICNVYKTGLWGTVFNNSVCFHRCQDSKSPFASVEPMRLADLSSLNWIENSLRLQSVKASNFIQICYCAINMRDILYVTGKSVCSYRAGCLGLEFSGIHQGKPVFGFSCGNALSTYVDPDSTGMVTFAAACSWNLAQAATIPVAYGTAYCALVWRGKTKPGEYVLIAGLPDLVGQAALLLGFHMRFKVFLLVNTKDEVDFLKTRFPFLTDDIFVNTTNSFNLRERISQLTKGHGMDVVIGDLTTFKIKDFINCLAFGGRYINVGKFVGSIQITIGLNFYAKGLTITELVFEDVLKYPSDERKQMIRFLQMGIKKSLVQPLPYKIFKSNELEGSFQYASQRNVMKPLVEVCNNTKSKNPSNIAVSRRTYFYPAKCYIILNALDDFGFELSNWMIERGARILVLLTIPGALTAYHRYRIRYWKQIGAEIIIDDQFMVDLSSTNDAISKWKTLGELGGIMCSVWNSLNVLPSTVPLDQICKAFTELDHSSRKLMPGIEHFALFSNLEVFQETFKDEAHTIVVSQLEAICRQRKSEGLSGLVVRWGDIKPFSCSLRATLTTSNFVPQTLASCFQILDNVLGSNKSVVTSFIPRTCDIQAENVTQNSVSPILTEIVKILGVSNNSKVNMNSTLVELGMDSLMSAEIAQMAIRQNISMPTAPGECSLSFFADLDRPNLAKEEQICNTGPETWKNELSKQIKLRNSDANAIQSMHFVNEHTSNLFVVHTLDGTLDVFEKLISKLSINVYGIQCDKNAPLESIQVLATYYKKCIKKIQASGPYQIAGYFFGATVAFEIVLQFEQEGENVALLLLVDASPRWNRFGCDVIDLFCIEPIDEQSLFFRILNLCLPDLPSSVTQQMISMSYPYDLKLIAERFMEQTRDFGIEQIVDVITSYEQRVKILMNYKPSATVSSKTVLLRTLIPDTNHDIEFDLNITDYCTNVDVTLLDEPIEQCCHNPDQSEMPYIVNSLVNTKE